MNKEYVEKGQSKDIVEILKNPPETAKGWTRWWWYGCAVTREEIDRELRMMKDAGFGGVEIAVLYPVAADDKEKGIYNIPYYSPEFFEILDFTLHTAESYGLGVDFTLGSSWPYGGSFVPHDMAPQRITTWQLDVAGPQKVFDYDFTTLIEGDIIGVTMGRMENSAMVPESVLDISNYLQDKQLYGWPWGKQLVGVPIPEGNWKITAFISEYYRQSMPIATRDANGYAIDHCRQDVTDFFMKNAAQPLLDRLGAGRIRCFFCDSIELGGNNWTEILPEEFQKRRGYDITPYLYGLVGNLGELTERVRYDYYLTMSELTLENFFGRMTSWCEEHGMQSRIQAHGTWGDILKAYGLADVPEGESFGPQDKLHVNTIQRRLASSAAHVYGRRIASNESFTWLRVPRFLVDLETVKVAADAIFLDGMNGIINHGYAYSPEEAGKPGWPFYASSNLNHTNPAWDCYPQIASYLQRMCGVLREGFARNDVAVYLPQADVWAETPMANLHLGMRLQERFGWGIPDQLAKEGYSFDYINDECITDLGVMDHGMKIGENCYKMILLIGCERLPLETAEGLEKFVRMGGKLLAAEKIPSKSCGMKDWKEQDRKVKEIMEGLFPENKNQWQSYEKGWTAVSTDRETCMHHLMRRIQQPDADIYPKTAPVGYVHRKAGTEDLYFLANISRESQRICVTFAGMEENFAVYDCLTAMEKKILSVQKDERGIQIELEIEASGSALIIFGAGRTAQMQKEIVQTGQIEIKDWILSVPERNVTERMETPVFWQKFETLKDYCETGIYEAYVDLPLEMSTGSREKMDSAGRLYLELNELADIARVELNGAPCGILWKRPWRLDVTEALKPGKNQIRLLCTGKGINSALNPENEPEYYEGTLVDGWPYFTETINQNRRRRISLEKERKAVKEPVNMGVQGTVRIVMEKEI